MSDERISQLEERVGNVEKVAKDLGSEVLAVRVLADRAATDARSALTQVAGVTTTVIEHVDRRIGELSASVGARLTEQDKQLEKLDEVHSIEVARRERELAADQQRKDNEASRALRRERRLEVLKWIAVFVASIPAVAVCWSYLTAVGAWLRHLVLHH